MCFEAEYSEMCVCWQIYHPVCFEDVKEVLYILCFYFLSIYHNLRDLYTFINCLGLVSTIHNVGDIGIVWVGAWGNKPPNVIAPAFFHASEDRNVLAGQSCHSCRSMLSKSALKIMN